MGFAVQAMLATSDSGALLRFVQRPNLVDLVEGESALQGAGRYSELVALYQARGQHEAALDLLRQVSQSPQELPTPPQGPPQPLADCQSSGCTPCVQCFEQVVDLSLHRVWRIQCGCRRAASCPDTGMT